MNRFLQSVLVRQSEQALKDVCKHDSQRVLAMNGSSVKDLGVEECLQRRFFAVKKQGQSNSQGGFNEVSKQRVHLDLESRIG